MHQSGRFARSCSHMRTMLQPFLRSERLTHRSRAILAASFFCQNAWLPLGLVECLGHPCQKHPSTKTASRAAVKRKSGFPKTGCFRRQPTMRCRRKSFRRASSVSLLPWPRMRDMTSERFALVKTSAMRMSVSFAAERGSKFNAPLRFLGEMNLHPVIQAAPLRVAGIQFVVKQFARLRPSPCLGREGFQRARPSAVRVVEAVRVQSRKEICHRAPSPDKIVLG
jgi:hypothetical protein